MFAEQQHTFNQHNSLIWHISIPANIQDL
jgi:hypothetical protein